MDTAGSRDHDATPLLPRGRAVPRGTHGLDLHGFAGIVVTIVVRRLRGVHVSQPEPVAPDPVADRGEQVAQELKGAVFELDELRQHRIALASRGKGSDDVVPEATQQVEKDVVT
jgi:hypothetical protein